ncbi:MAG: tRNA (guanosine(37)-N1)-methyltransferase TrmD [Chloroflexi bacterium]|nr:tRNA (guanosine(37)-N1)-methyltransferase TrmD [Chloroflexota bacterium]
MKFHVVTLFPEMFDGPITSSIIGRAVSNGIIEIEFVNPREFTTDKHRSVDAPPYGGGPGMVMMAPPLAKAVDSINDQYGTGHGPKTILMSPQGIPMNHKIANDLSDFAATTLVCGHYEGVDERFIEEYVDLEISVGDFVMTGGEIPAMAVIDSVTRLLPGALGSADSTISESFSVASGGMLEGPVYTRPLEFHGRRAPEVLLNGNRQEVEQYRKRVAAERTMARRPDLIRGWGPDPEDGDLNSP